MLGATVDRVIATGLEVPWGLAFLPDGSALVSERDSDRIKHVAPSGAVDDVGKVDGVDGDGEGGLLGIALSPSYDSDHRLFAYYTHGDENVIARMTYDDARLSDQRVVFDGIPSRAASTTAAGWRSGRTASCTSAPATPAAAARPRTRATSAARSCGSRQTASPPRATRSAARRSGATGTATCRAWPSTRSGQLWASEFGQNTWDELNRIEPGGNYGWPVVEGRAGRTGYVDPVRQWHTDVASPSGIAIAGNAVYMAALRGERLWQIPIPGGRAGKPKALLTGKYGRLRTVAVAPDGSLWLTTSNRDGRGDPRQGDDRIIRLTLS